MAYKFNPFTGNLDVVGPVLTGTGTVSAAADGTEALPGISFANDLDTGITRTGVDQLALATNGTGRLFINSSGRLGVGTNSPSGLLHLKGGGIRIQSDDNTDEKFIEFRNAVDGSTRGFVGYSFSDDALKFRAGGSGEKMRIDSSGNVGIGASSITNLTGYAQLVLNNTNGGFIDIEDDGVTQARIIGSGNRLTLRTTETGGAIIFDSQTIKTTGVFSVAGGTADTPSIAFDGDPDTGIYRPGADQLALATNGTGRLFVDSLGNVAIGTTSITNLTDYAQLVLNNTNGGFIDIEDNGVTQARIIGSGNELTLRAAATGGAIIFDTDGSNERARIDSLGRLLVGMSSQSGGSLLQVNDDRIRIASSKTPASASDTGTAGEICWDENYIYVCIATDTWKRAALSTW